MRNFVIFIEYLVSRCQLLINRKFKYNPNKKLIPFLSKKNLSIQ